MKSPRMIRALTIGVALSALLAQPLAAADAEWKFYTYFAANDKPTALHRAFAEDVTKATGGKLKITVYSSGELPYKASDVLRTVASGESYVSPTLSARLLSDSVRSGAAPRPDPIEDLTAREREILTLVASGLSNKHVALRLDLQEKTVKHHMTRILAKLNVRNRTEVAMALRDATERGF